VWFAAWPVKCGDETHRLSYLSPALETTNLLAHRAVMSIEDATPPFVADRSQLLGLTSRYR